MVVKIPNITKSIKPYVLVSKEKGISITPDRNLPELIGLKEPTCADVVVIAKSNNPQQKKIITTYKDKNNKIIERVYSYEGFDIPETHRLYNDLPNHGYKNLNGRLVQVFENLDRSGKYKAWKKISSEKQYVNTNNNNEKTHVTIAKVSTDERFLNPTSVEQHSLKEYYVPKAHGGTKKTPKSIEFETKKDSDGIPEITKITSTDNVAIPKNDSYLAFRIYDNEDMKVPITRRALKDSHLKGLNIRIEDAYNMKETTSGSFDHNMGIIKFNVKDLLKPEIINTAYHETQHAFQYAVMAITKRFENTPFAKKCLDKFKGKITPSIERDADMYYNAKLNYIQPKQNYQQYRENLLEKEAWEIGDAAEDDYISEGWELAAQFRNIPKYEL